MENILLLKPVTKDYVWGNDYFIPSLLRHEKDGSPVAELWMGTHKDGCAVVEKTGQSLSDFLDENPDFAGCTGKEFPYLFKVLGIAKPLSIQVHPNAKQAAEQFALGNPNYKDGNEKAEMYYALTPTRLLCGLRKAYSKDEEALALTEQLKALYPDDPMADSPCRMNIVDLDEGDAIYVKPGTLHAYMSGNGIELMTNSDNVVRAGLTNKRIDKEELNRIMDHKSLEPGLLWSLEDESGEHFHTEAGLVLTVMKEGFFRSESDTARILFCTDGFATINDEFTLEQGQVCIVRKGFRIDVETDGTVFMAEKEN